MTEQALLAAVLADPADDAPRLIMADWLDENGEVERAEFIRVQCKLFDLRRGPAGQVSEESPWLVTSREYNALRRRERELSEDATGWPILTGVLFMNADWRISRGFISGVTCTAEDWIAHAEAILAVQPVREVTLTTWPGSEYGWVVIFEERWPGIKFTLPPPAAPAHDRAG